MPYLKRALGTGDAAAARAACREGFALTLHLLSRRVRIRALRDASSAGDGDGETWVHLAARASTTGALTWLLEHKFDVNSLNHVGDSPLALAQRNRRWSSIDALLNAGATVGNRGGCGLTEQERAANMYARSPPQDDAFSSSALRKCMSRGVWSRPECLNKAFAKACVRNHRLLYEALQPHATLDFALDNGDTPLTHFAHAGDPQSVKRLLAAGASPRFVNSGGRTALDVAVGVEVRTVLIAAGSAASRQPEVAPATPSDEASSSSASSPWLCAVCYDAPKEVIVAPCNHFGLCEECANKACVGGLCPFCRTPVCRIERVFVI